MKNQTERLKRERERVLDCRGRPSMLPFVITNASIFRPCPPVQLSLSFYLSFHSLSAELACQWHAETRRRIFPPFLFFLSLLPSFFFKLFSRRSRNFNSLPGTAKLFQFSRFLRLGLIKRRKRTVFLSLSIGWDTRLSNLSLLIFNNNEWLLAILACISILFFLSLFL